MNYKTQTEESFRNKWKNNTKLAFSETLKEESDIFQWIIGRNGFNSPTEFEKFLGKKRRILDAGCGNGRVTALLHRYASDDSYITGIDLTAAEIARENLSGLNRITTFTKDLLGDLSDLGKFDFIYCQEVLHHTADPQKAFLNLCSLLDADGEIAIYVYKIKAPLREYADDYIRKKISGLSYEDATNAMKELTELSRILSNLNMKVTIPDVNVLGIQAGEYDIQRMIYHFFLKCFWNQSLNYDENVAINYDWYHPQLCSRHTLEEIRGWFEHAGLKITHECVDHYGITMRGINRVA